MFPAPVSVFSIVSETSSASSHAPVDPMSVYMDEDTKERGKNWRGGGASVCLSVQGILSRSVIWGGNLTSLGFEFPNVMSTCLGPS